MRARAAWSRRFVIFLASAASCVPLALVAAPASGTAGGEGSLDPSFGYGGRIVDWSGDDTNNFVADTAVLADGSYAVAISDSHGFGITAAKYHADGSPDRRFGGDGRSHAHPGDASLDSPVSMV